MQEGALQQMEESRLALQAAERDVQALHAQLRSAQQELQAARLTASCKTTASSTAQAIASLLGQHPAGSVGSAGDQIKHRYCRSMHSTMFVPARDGCRHVHASVQPQVLLRAIAGLLASGRLRPHRR